MNKFIKLIGAVAIINVVARVFGFLREMIIAYQFGTGHTSDSISTAYMIPNFLYLVVGGAFTTVFISIYNRESTDKGLFVKQSFTIVAVTATIMTLIGMIFADPILDSFKTDKIVSEEEVALTRDLYLWMMPSSIFLVLSSWYSGLLNVNQKFHLSSFAILIYNAVFLLIAVVLSQTIGPIGYGISAFASAILMVYFLVIGYRKLDSFKVGLSFKQNVSTKELWIMVVPIMLGGATVQLYALLQRYIAGLLSLEGAVSSVNYASKLMQFPQAILITAVTTVIYPILSQKEADNDHASIKSLYSKGLHYLLLLLAPVTIFSYFYSTSLIQVVFEYSNFNAKSTAATAPVLAVFVLSMYFLAANGYITRFYYAKGDSMAPVIFSLLNVFGVNIAVIFLMVDSTGVVSIAWGTLISSIVNFIMLVVYASIKYDLKMGIFSKELQFFRALPPLIVITIVMYFSSEYLVFDNKWVTFIVGLVIFSAVLAGSYLLFGVKEVKEFSDKLKRKLLKQ
ncbi:murein biosynthesis integral membrane protein MurJ [Lysinibacillus sp. G4S2]|uniref:murein biosynthesis integral membrane protein MurJ n=1 Tax=Lysinibacillus sp. G4S2 TaxID=3055859 RepID=UPI0025A0C629|nr:murein biosynthesis integral membrane protein MurJ [Lysinibacillus sp. G4S2]MDM5246466.1 murein biosynthesis integral membrane protein MurJ [Lysinibacillus sp. G4S2]